MAHLEHSAPYTFADPDSGRQESGYAATRAAQADGRWDAAYESQRNATAPEDLSAALADNDRARHRFELLDRTHRYAPCSCA